MATEIPGRGKELWAGLMMAPLTKRHATTAQRDSSVSYQHFPTASPPPYSMHTSPSVRAPAKPGMVYPEEASTRTITRLVQVSPEEPSTQTEKLKLLYKLHLNPVLCPEEAESALEAASFFTDDRTTEDELKEAATEGGGDDEDKREDKVKDYKYYLRMWAKEKEPEKETIKDLPRMSQEHFIELCKTLYNMFSEDPREQELYHSIATVASLLLRIGEVAKRFTNHNAKNAKAPPPSPLPAAATAAARPQGEEWCGDGPSGQSQDVCKALAEAQLDALPPPPTQSSDEDAPDDTSVSSYSVVSAGSLQCDDIADDTVLIGCGERRRGSVVDSDWSVMFEQMLASMLTEPPLVDYFEKKGDIQGKMAACKAQRNVERQVSSSSDQELAPNSA